MLIDRAPPLEILTCEACDGKGYTIHRVEVYEHGCGFSHVDFDERPCEHCLGLGEFVEEAQGRTDTTGVGEKP